MSVDSALIEGLRKQDETELKRELREINTKIRQTEDNRYQGALEYRRELIETALENTSEPR